MLVYGAHTELQCPVNVLGLGSKGNTSGVSTHTCSPHEGLTLVVVSICMLTGVTISIKAHKLWLWFSLVSWVVFSGSETLFKLECSFVGHTLFMMLT